MSRTGFNDDQLLIQARTALREKDAERADALLTKHAERSLAKNKAQIANDVV